MSLVPLPAQAVRQLTMSAWKAERLWAIPSRRQSSAMLSSPFRPSRTILIFSSPEYYLRCRTANVIYGAERRSKCSLHTSNASSGWVACDYVVHAVQKMNSSSLTPPRTSANRRRSSLHRSNRKSRNGKGDCASPKSLPSAPATRVFQKNRRIVHASRCRESRQKTSFQAYANSGAAKTM